MPSDRPRQADSEIASALVALITIEPGALDRRVAGIAIGARIAAEACRAGAQALWMLSDAEPSVAAETWEDIARLCGSMQVVTLAVEDAQARLAEQPDRLLLLLSESHLVPASLYPRLIEEGSLAASGKVVAAVARARGPLPILGAPSDEDCPEIIDLVDAAAATRIVVRATAKASDGIISRHLNRPISQRISTALLLATPKVRPWQVTLATAAMIAVMFVCLVLGGSKGLIAGGLLFHAASVLDGVDGEIARATFRSSVGGAILDSAVDMVGTLLYMIGLTIGLTHLHGLYYAEMGGWAVIAGATGLTGLSLLTIRVGEHGNFNILKTYYGHKFPTGFPAQVRQWITRITSRDFFAFGCCVLTLLGKAQLALIGFTGFTTLWVLLIILAAPALLRHSAPTRVNPATT